MIRWQILLKEHQPTFVHVPGKKNNADDTLSQLEMTHKSSNKIE